MTAVGVIPARFGATRFPGKPLAPVAGRPMLQHVWDGARRATGLRTVVIATDDERIAAACSQFGAEVVMTRDDHPTGTDRLAEVAANLDDDIIVNIQGDEPLIEGFVVDAALDALLGDPAVSMSTLVHAAEPEARNDPNRVKVVLDHAGRALYFSRAPIPYQRDKAPAPTLWQHVGIYAYRRPFLLDFVKLEQTTAERSEGLEQLRALEHGHAIRCGVIAGWQSVPVDVPEDIPRVETALKEAGRS
jgi:3-deoxy-manno-octulosonate cytidylyltransferase (CMP-KDO synthetase)